MKQQASVHAVSLMRGEVCTNDPSFILHTETPHFSLQDRKRSASECNTKDVTLQTLSVLGREQPSPKRAAEHSFFNSSITQEASELKIRIDQLEQALKQKDFNLTQSEITIDIERQKCIELREALNSAEKRIEYVSHDWTIVMWTVHC
jgi:hypothetical protein